MLHLLDREAVVSSEALDLIQRHRMHFATGRTRSAPQTDREQAAGSNQTRELAEGPVSIRWRNVLPDSAQHHDIEADRELAQDGQFRKPIVYPTNPRVGVKTLPLAAHTARR